MVKLSTRQYETNILNISHRWCDLMKLISNSQVLKIDDIMPIGQQKILIRVMKVRAAAELARNQSLSFHQLLAMFLFHAVFTICT